MLSLGIPKEIKAHEKRVGLTPQGVGSLSEAEIPVYVEKGAGEASGFSDFAYQRAGARILSKASQVYEKADLIQKVKEPQPQEWSFLKAEQVLFSFLHLASPEHCGLCRTLLRQRVTALGFETVSRGGRAILLEPMSEIAGRLAALFSAFFRHYARAEQGKIVYPARLLEKLEFLANEYPNIPDHLTVGRAVVFGGGKAGYAALETLLRLGASVDLIEKSGERRSCIQEKLAAHKHRLTLWPSEGAYQDRLREAEVLIGCVHVLGERAPRVVSEEGLCELSKERPKIIMDVAVDQGGNFPQSRSTPYEDPLFLDSFGNLRFGVANIPSLCGTAASKALERVTLPYTMALARNWKEAFQVYEELQRGLQIWKGRLVNEAVAKAHQLPWECLNLANLS